MDHLIERDNVTYSKIDKEDVAVDTQLKLCKIIDIIHYSESHLDPN
jgi:hypothetical protein